MNEKLPKGIRKQGNIYEGRACIKGHKISVRGKDLEDVIVRFQKEKLMYVLELQEKSNSLTLDTWFYEWLSKVKKNNVKSTSLPTIAGCYRRTFGKTLGNKPIRLICSIDIQDALNKMKEQGISSSSMRDGLSNLKECLSFAVGNKLIDSNPAIAIKVPYSIKPSKEIIVLSKEEEQAFLKAVEGTWYYEMFYFMFYTGARVGEVGGLKWSDIDFDREIIYIRRSLSIQYVNGEKHEELVCPKSINSIRKIPFILDMKGNLISQREKQKHIKELLGSRWRANDEFEDLVFTTGMGSPCSRYIIEKELKNLLKQMQGKEVRRFYPHCIRHTFATRCFECGMDPKVVQTLMGHSSISITMDYYTHVMDERMRQEVEKFSEARNLN